MHLDRWNEPRPPAMTALARWMDSWAGLSAVVVGMAAQGCDLQLTEYAGENWRATFFVTGMAHSIAKGSAYEPTPWRAVQQAVWEALSARVQSPVIQWVPTLAGLIPVRAPRA
jgi:hypothetical protein